MKGPKTCNYCGKSLHRSFLFISDATWEDFNTMRLTDSSTGKSCYCNLFCLMKDLSENLETSAGQTIN